ncbi:MAG: nucleotide-sugar transporter-domain-containing protein [Olpidium bornovanus]|uniref:Nucleotide-sugar transporter-domain-containing protein n=1 Tax=Olpidium bornovanus TaxID=278681 RepID=A0A8H8DM26_9FUNG|nr:MAG: nucleotide-sugar transporter-domain-containing protein [Olpidium bornovanus]
MAENRDVVSNLLWGWHLGGFFPFALSGRRANPPRHPRGQRRGRRRCLSCGAGRPPFCAAPSAAALPRQTWPSRPVSRLRLGPRTPPEAMAHEPALFGLPLKHLALVTLVVQNSLLVIVMRYSRLLPGPQYFTTTAVVVSEISKLVICLAVYFREGRARAASGHNLLPSSDDLHELPSSVVTEGDAFVPTAPFLPWKLFREVFSSDAWKMLVPAALYTVQNNLQYVAVSILDAATFQVTYQLKILTTALFSVLLLKRDLSVRKWLSLVLLTAGVVLVQLPSNSSVAGGGDAAEEIEAAKVADEADYRFLGLLAVACACVLSGLAGVYFEMVLKGTQTSVWVRNVQLSLFSIPPAIIAMCVQHGQGVVEHGFFYGYNSVVFAAIACQAGGGIIVALVVKYADNILKGFATSVSIILSCIASVFLFNFTVTGTFLVGAFLVIYATYIYGLPDERRTAAIDIPLTKGETDLHRSDHR